MQKISRLETRQTVMQESGEKSLITEMNLESEEEMRIESALSQVIFIREGGAICRLDTGREQEVETGNFFFLAAGYVLNIQAMEDAHIICLSIPEDSLSCQDHFFRKLDGSRDEGLSIRLHCLAANDIINTYIRSLGIYHYNVGAGAEFIHAKIVELFYILQFFYPEKDLGDFFRSYLTEDNRFKEQVRLHYRKARTVQELASLLYYSYSGFNKRFKKAFGVSAYSWMQRQRARMVYHELDKGCKSLKEICADHGFVSLSHFNEFCHKELGDSPSVIRKKERMVM